MSQPFFRLSRMALATALALLLVLGAFSSPAQTPQTPPAPQAPPVQWPRSHDYDVQHYRIEVSFDWTAKSVNGTTTITLRPFKSDLKEIEVDAGHMKINAVKLASGGALTFRY